MNITSKVLCTLTAAVALSFTASALAEAPHWDSTIGLLEQAKADMNKAISRGGKKAEALKKIDEAIALLKSEQGEIQANTDKKAAKKGKKE